MFGHMDANMTKDQLAWLLIRFVGLILILFAIARFASVISGALQAAFAFAAPIKLPGIEGVDTKSLAVTTFFYALAQFSVYAGAGLYFLFGGKWAFKLITRE